MFDSGLLIGNAQAAKLRINCNRNSPSLVTRMMSFSIMKNTVTYHLILIFITIWTRKDINYAVGVIWLSLMTGLYNWAGNLERAHKELEGCLLGKQSWWHWKVSPTCILLIWITGLISEKISKRENTIIIQNVKSSWKISC